MTRPLGDTTRATVSMTTSPEWSGSAACSRSLNDPAAGRHHPRDREHDHVARAEWERDLFQRFAEAPAPDDQRPIVILQAGGECFRGACGGTVDHDDQWKAGELILAAGKVLMVRVGLPPATPKDKRDVRKHVRRHFHGALQPPA